MRTRDKFIQSNSVVGTSLSQRFYTPPGLDLSCVCKLTICLQIQQIASAPGVVCRHVESGFMLRLIRLPLALTTLFPRSPRGLLFENLP
jgi:hypothetical protein